MSARVERHNTITRKNLVSSLMIGLIIGLLAGLPLGWIAHQLYAEQRLADVLVCREKNRNLPEVQVQSICGSRF